MRVHPSNFRISGFTARPELRELAALGTGARKSRCTRTWAAGAWRTCAQFGIDEPLAVDSLTAGVDLVSFSGDKLLGGPQAGILAGQAEVIARLRRNPLFRALRVDKVIYQALENTLRNLLLERWDEDPGARDDRADADGVRISGRRRLLTRFPGLPMRRSCRASR